MRENKIELLLRTANTIAIVGLSDNPDRDSYRVAEYLQKAGYKIIPVNPNLTAWNGIQAYANLGEVKEKIDIVDIFRRSEFIEEIVDQASALHPLPRAIWMQLGIENERAAKKARAAGMVVIENRCIKIEHARLLNR